ncbi:zinc-binding alcohol dehydrogenase [Xylanibacillus composti]|nr:zinc-binding alcohol dehydrogenase [Xylanibacillus composti]
MMKALILTKPGALDTLEAGELPIPEPAPGEIRVRVHAAGLNPIDYKLVPNGLPAWTYPFVSGVDAAGVVDAVGEGVTTWKIGDRVVYHGNFTKQGTFAEYHITTAHTAAALPEDISFEDAAAFPCAGLTAYQAIQRKMRIGPGMSVLIHAGAGGVGGYAIQIAKALGASQIVATASPANFDLVRKLGAHEVIDYNTENVRERVMALTEGRGVDGILNSLNRATAQADMDMLAFGGQLACIAGAPENVADFQPSFKTFTVHKLMLGGAHLSGDRRAEEDLATMAQEFMQLMRAGKIDAMVSEIIALEDIPKGLARLAERHVRGKIVARITQA